MAIKITYNYFVKVTPDLWLRQDAYAACEELVDDIQRHVEGFQEVTIKDGAETTCEFCGRAWTEDSKTYNGGCCKDDESQRIEEANT